MALTRHVVVIGAGIVGAASALALLRDGHRVTVLEPGPPGGEQAASYGNGAWLSPGSVVPMSMPGLWKKVPGMLADPLGPLAIRWRYLPRLVPWLLRFVRAGSTVARVERTAAALRPLLHDTVARHQALAEGAGVGDLIERRGILYVFPDRAAFEAEALAWRLRRDNGLEWLELDADELRQAEPGLNRRYGFGVLVQAGGNVADPGAYVAALVAYAVVQGATLVPGAATGFRMDGQALRAVTTAAGEIACDSAVVCAGAHSAKLAHQAGDHVSLETERGYHAAIEAPEVVPRHPLMPSDGKMAISATRTGLRVAGQVELAGLEAAPNWDRARLLRDFLVCALPGLPQDLPPERVRFWMGHRPSTPDGLPVIGRASGCPDIVHAFGHGHVGLAAGASTGALVADLVAGRVPPFDLRPYSPQRFQ